MPASSMIRPVPAGTSTVQARWVQSVVPVFDSGVLLIVHESAVGYVTLIDVTDPERSTSHSIRSFLLEDIL